MILKCYDWNGLWNMFPIFYFSKPRKVPFPRPGKALYLRSPWFQRSPGLLPCALLSRPLQAFRRPSALSNWCPPHSDDCHLTPPVSAWSSGTWSWHYAYYERKKPSEIPWVHCILTCLPCGRVASPPVTGITDSKILATRQPLLFQVPSELPEAI